MTGQQSSGHYSGFAVRKELNPIFFLQGFFSKALKAPAYTQAIFVYQRAQLLGWSICTQAGIFVNIFNPTAVHSIIWHRDAFLFRNFCDQSVSLS